MKKQKGVFPLIIMPLLLVPLIYFGFFSSTVGFSLADHSTVIQDPKNPSVSYPSSTFQSYTFGEFGSITGFPVIKAGSCEIRQYSADPDFFQVYVNGKSEGTPLVIKTGMGVVLPSEFYGGRCSFQTTGGNPLR